MKTCTKCGETKPLDDFHRNRTKADGRQPWCRECAQEYQHRYYVENRDQVLENTRRYYEENRDKELECQRWYREENREHILAAKRARDHETQSLSAAMATIPLRTPWSAKEDAFLMDDDGMTVFQKAVHLGRTYESCTKRRRVLRKQEVTA